MQVKEAKSHHVRKCEQRRVGLQIPKVDHSTRSRSSNFLLLFIPSFYSLFFSFSQFIRNMNIRHKMVILALEGGEQLGTPGSIAETEALSTGPPKVW